MLVFKKGGASHMSEGTTMFGKRRFALRRYGAVFLMTTLALCGCGKPEKQNLPSELNLNKNTVNRPVPKRQRPEERSATNDEGSRSEQGDSVGSSGSSSDGNAENGSGSNGAAAGDASGNSGGASEDGGSGNDSGTSGGSSGSPSSDGSKSDAGSGGEGGNQSGSLPGRGSGVSNMSVAAAQKSAQQQLNRARRALDKGDLAEAATAASAAYAASSLYAASDAVCQRIKKQAGSLIESMGKKQSGSQTVLTFQ